MGQITIPGSINDVSDGFHTFGELYDHRNILFMALLKQFTTDAWMSRRHNDDSQWEGWFIAGTTLCTGDITYHLPLKYWDDLASTNIRMLERAPIWDNHNSKDVCDRLLDYVKTPTRN